MNLKKVTLVTLGLLVVLGINNLWRSSEPRQVIDSKPAQSSEIVTPIEYQRPLNQTLLTFSEWYLVYSPSNFATFIKTYFTNQFPFFGESLQFWQGYYQINRYAKQLNYSNVSYHIMLWVIGSSTTIEYTIRGIYEQTIGAFTASVSGRVQEDDYAARVAQDYVDFINKRPWYEFDFGSALKHLWTDNASTPLSLRKFERLYVLTSEYLVKMIYAKVIKLGTHSAFGVAKPTTAVVLQAKATEIPKSAEIKQRYENGDVLVLAPRYEPFTQFVLELSKQPAAIKEIAGNNHFITISAISADTANLKCSACLTLFTQNILTQPHQIRTVLIAPVTTLLDNIRAIQSSGYRIEHVYDF